MTTSAQWQERLIDLPERGGAMHGWSLGDSKAAPDLVFVHANGFNAGTYHSILGPLGGELNLLACDQRGHGLSTLPAYPGPRRDWSDLRDDLIALIDALDAPPMVLAGHSMGGTSCMLAAAERPDRVRGVVMFDPVIIDREIIAMAQRPGAELEMWDKQPMVLAARKRRAAFSSREEALIAYTGRGAFRTWPAKVLADYVCHGLVDDGAGGVRLACDPAWEASNFGAQALNPWDARGRVACPVRILTAEHASTCRIGDGVEFREGFADVAMEMVEGASHFLPMEFPERVRAELQAMCDNDGDPQMFRKP